MKVIGLGEFLKLPSGTVYQKYQPQCFGDLNIKEESMSSLTKDFVSCDLLNSLDMGEEWTEDTEFEKLDNGQEVKKDFNTSCRDGFFDENQLYAVWSNDDILGLITRLNSCVDRSKVQR